MKDLSLTGQKCRSYKAGERPLSTPAARLLLRQIPGWDFTSNKKGIYLALRMKDFLAAIELMRKIARVAQKEDHHPDLHLTSYRTLRIDLSTHSIGGLSQNDFIMAAKIDRLPKKLKA